MGEVTQNIRTFALPNESTPYTFVMNFEYDSWNRIQIITYPDGEKVNYGLYGYDSVRYTFSAKEKDAETGYSYFGSRYYHSDLSIWLSIDPMSDKYPSLSPYVYCADNPVRLIDPNGDTIKVVNRQNQFLFSLDNKSLNTTILTAKDLYDKGIQWFEPNADNYFPLICVNSNIKEIDGIDHYSWEDIESFSMTDRCMKSYQSGGDGDFKKGKNFLSTIDGVPYWTDAIGQIPFAINCYKMILSKVGSHKIASVCTKRIGNFFADGSFSIDINNSYDNKMIERACNWARFGFRINKTKFGRYEIVRTDYDFSNIAVWN